MTHTLTPPPPSPTPPPPSSAPPPPPPPPALQTSRVQPSRFRRNLGVAGRLVFVAAGIALSFQMDSSIFGVVGLLFILVGPFEKLYPRQKGQRWRRPLVLSDISFALMSPVLNVVGLTVAVAIGMMSFFWLPGLALRPVVAVMPGWMIPVVAFLLFDFLGYWTHRWAHEVPFLWRFHAVHHSPQHMDWISGFRIHPFDGVLIAPAFLFLLAAGFDVELTGLLAIFQIVLGLFFHANVRVRWRWLDKLVCNPEFHHWHHANESDAIGHNYSPAVPWWDLAFGTFFMPNHKSGRRPQHYGIDEYLPNHMVGQLLYPLRGARKYLSLWCHPIRATKRGFSGVRKLLGDVWRTSSRPTHSRRRETQPGSFSTNASLFEKHAEPTRSAHSPDACQTPRL